MPPAPLPFDGGVLSENDVPINNWRYFLVTVPTNALGWDLRLVNVVAGNPQMVVSRDTLPDGICSCHFPYAPYNGWYYPNSSTTWPSASRHSASRCQPLPSSS